MPPPPPPPRHIHPLPQVSGATAHFDAVVGGATSGVLGAATDTGVPVIFGVLTCDTMEQVCVCGGGGGGGGGGGWGGGGGSPGGVGRVAIVDKVNVF